MADRDDAYEELGAPLDRPEAIAAIAALLARVQGVLDRSDRG
jgi:hypothetical protein